MISLMKATKQGMKGCESCLFVSVLINLFDVYTLHLHSPELFVNTLISFWIPKFFLYLIVVVLKNILWNIRSKSFYLLMLLLVDIFRTVCFYLDRRCMHFDAPLFIFCRTVAATNMNETSSRSHAIFSIVFTQRR